MYCCIQTQHPTTTATAKQNVNMTQTHTQVLLKSRPSNMIIKCLAKVMVNGSVNQTKSIICTSGEYNKSLTNI